MKEQVKEWIVDKNLTIDSFDSIMIGVIYNSGHNTLDDPDVRKWIEMHPSEFREMLLPNLNENQQIVMEFLKNEYNGSTMINPMALIFVLHDEVGKDSEIDAVEAYIELSGKEEIQVLQVFSQWALEQEEE